MELNIEKQAQLEHLRSNGAYIEDHDTEEVSYHFDGYDYRISWDDFDVTDSMTRIKSSSDLYSCCGDVVDQDYMMCPTCKEHL